MRANHAMLLALFLFSCNEPTQVTQNKHPSSVKTIGTGKKPVDYSIYKKLIPAGVRTQLTHYLPAWHLPAPSNWEVLWFDDYLKNGNGNLVDYVKGNFNTDTIADYAFILANKKGQCAAWAMLSNDTRFITTKIMDIRNPGGKLELGLELIRKGKLQYVNLEAGSAPQLIDLKTDALQITVFEQGATAYYWEDSKLKSVTIGD